ncbi:hypothetical protein CDD81_753 [Ophiocordyceps australis]|uniref:GMP synthase n=1 Tax=Ophiocordyceps australis TaxID=1399860 RepID=A0A2C5Y0D8_9HYPO|nr:hypothetical protein CDD81_753 [Ophiocordyceps australis]
MSAFKDLVKKGWHPEKEGTTLKSQVSSLVGRKQDSASTDATPHSSRPLSSLKDPATFAPPPRRTAAPPPPSFTGPRNVVPAPSKYSDAHVAASVTAPALPPPGVSVPQLGIGRAASPAKTTDTPPLSAAAASKGTSWAEKQAAVKTAASFHKDPSSVSLADAKRAASTANNFRQRHGDQVAAGVGKAQGIDQKYGISNRLGALVGAKQDAQPVAAAGSSSPPPAASGLAGKKKPPPPPPKKSALGGSSIPSRADDLPPEIPMATRPSF